MKSLIVVLALAGVALTSPAMAGQTKTNHSPVVLADTQMDTVTAGHFDFGAFVNYLISVGSTGVNNGTLSVGISVPK